VAPLQKAGIVDLIKKRTSDMTLAIGDGINFGLKLVQHPVFLLLLNFYRSEEKYCPFQVQMMYP
jgi:hypothetical protein